jgi:hypothetical protein
MGGKVGRGADPGNCDKGIFTANTRKCSTHFYAFFAVFCKCFVNYVPKIADEPRWVTGGFREALFLLYGSCLPNS